MYMSKQNIKIQMNIPLIIQQEHDFFIAYTPVFDISTQGKTQQQANDRFIELVQIYIEELLNDRSLDTVLTELGWKKENKSWNPPIITQTLQPITVSALNA